MKRIGLAMVLLVGCVDSGPTGHAAEALTGSGSGSGTGGGGTQVWHSVWNGGNANASSWGPYSSAYVDAYENLSGRYRYASLGFSFSSVDPNSLQCYTYTDWWGYTYSWCYYTRFTWGYGWGQIPEQDFHLTPNGAHVKYTVGSDPAFYSYTCTIDYSNWVFTCGNGAGGDVDVAWGKSGGWSQSFNGTQQTSYGPYTFQSSGTWTSSAAHAQGTLLGTAFDGYGGFGDTHLANVSKDILTTSHP